MTTVQKIRALAKARGMSIAMLESALGFSMGLIGKWEKNTPGSDKILKVANFFGTTTDYLLREDMDSPLHPSDMDALPASYFQLLDGARNLDLSERDVSFLLEVARSYKKNSGEGSK